MTSYETMGTPRMAELLGMPEEVWDQMNRSEMLTSKLMVEYYESRPLDPDPPSISNGTLRALHSLTMGERLTMLIRMVSSLNAQGKQVWAREILESVIDERKIAVPKWEEVNGGS